MNAVNDCRVTIITMNDLVVSKIGIKIKKIKKSKKIKNKNKIL